MQCQCDESARPLAAPSGVALRAQATRRLRRGRMPRNHESWPGGESRRRDCRLRGPVLFVPPDPLSFKIQTLSVAMRSQAIRENSCVAKATFVTGGAMKPAGLAMARTRRSAKPRHVADAPAPSRHRATHRHAGFVVAPKAQTEFAGTYGTVYVESRRC